jgi:RHS repeat-associated protein
VQSVDTVGPTVKTTDSYTYTATGDAETRNLNGTTQTLAWDTEDHLASVTQPSGSTTKTTSYVYDADGNRLLRRSSTGVTLYLGQTQIDLAKSTSTPKATRYYDIGNGNQAVRTNDNKLSFLIADHHGTAELAVNAADLTEQQRRTTPFGANRGTQPSTWPGDKGFVGGTQDAETGLTQLGAREYDSTTGQFVSVDPVFIPTDPRTFDGYSYSAQNPVTLSDPSGRQFTSEDHSGGSNDCSRKKIVCIDDPPVPVEELVNKEKDGTDYNHDGYSTIHPGVNVPNDWKNKAQFIDTFFGNMAAEKTCSQAQMTTCYYVAPGEPWADTRAPIANELLTSLIFRTCGEVDYEHCQVAGGSLAEMVASGGEFTAMAGGGEGPSGGGGVGTKTCNSFLPATKVLMADGSTKEIQDVRIGDKVVATDPETGKKRTETITAEIATQGVKHLVKITVDIDGDKGAETASITSTEGHPYWVPKLDTWIVATGLRPGQVLQTATGTQVPVTAVKRWTVLQSKVHNLTIDDLHTYYVLAGATPVLVHNDSGFDWEKELENLKKSWDSGDLDDDGYHAPRGNQAENKEFKDALREIERSLGREITPAERRSLHDRITGQGYGYHRIVEEGKGLFGGC